MGSGIHTLTVKRLINAPASAIFSVLADHAGYAQFPGIDRVEILRAGRDDRNDIGLQRRITVGRLKFLEEITVFEPPYQLGYRIVRSTLPMKHEQATIELHETSAGTQVVWSSRFSVPLPLVGGLLAGLLEREVAKGYAGTLKAIERRLLNGATLVQGVT